MDTAEEISSIFDSLREYLEQEKRSKDQWVQVYKLEDELNSSRATNNSLNATLKMLLEKEDAKINTNYVDLQRRHHGLLKEINVAEKELENLKIDIAEDNKIIKLKSENRMKIKEESEKKMIQEIKEKIEKRKEEHRKKVEQLNYELDITQTTTIMERDDIETTLRRELIDLNANIWREQKYNSDLQMQLEELKRRQQTTPIISQQPIRPITVDSDALSLFQLDQLEEIFESQVTDTARNGSGLDLPTKAMQSNANHLAQDSSSSKYQPLQIFTSRQHPPLSPIPTTFQKDNSSRQNKSKILGQQGQIREYSAAEAGGVLRRKPATFSNGESSVERNWNTKKPVKFDQKAHQHNQQLVDGKFKRQSKQKNQRGKINEEPNATHTIKKPPKKRKLYNADNLDYLENMQWNSQDSD